MVTISPSTDYAGGRSAARPAVAVAGARDPRLDFFRGLAMFIILVAHIPNNIWANWIPARFGFSDATEIFVFCSGMASAIAFGGTFARKGWWIGTARVIYRTWQVYWAHIGLFFVLLTALSAINLAGRFDGDYVAGLNLQHFVRDPMPNLVGLFTLTYVPNYFDILPMYMVVLLMMPIYVALARVHFLLAAGASLALWGAASFSLLPLPAEPWSDRPWFFNPFAWQLLFFTGFAFMRGWIPAPPVSRWLVVLAAAFVVLSAPFGAWKVFEWVRAANPALADLILLTWEPSAGLRDKSEFGVLRYVHFLSLAYLAWVAVGPAGHRLSVDGVGPLSTLGRGLMAVITKVGQQSLAIFVFSMALAPILGFGLDLTARAPIHYVLFNIGGFVLMIAVAYSVAWFKANPWKSKK